MLGTIRKNQLAWTLHVKRLSDDEERKINEKRWRRKRFQLIDNIKIKGRYDLTKRREWQTMRRPAYRRQDATLETEGGGRHARVLKVTNYKE